MSSVGIRLKLVLIIMITSVTVLLLTGATFVIWEQVAFRQDLVQNLSAQGQMIAESSWSALASEDIKELQSELNILRARPSIVFACIYDKNGRILASYYHGGTVKSIQIPKLQVQEKNYYFGNGFLTLFQPIVLDNEVTGTVCLISDLTQMYAMLKGGIDIIAIVLLVASLVAYFMSARLQKIISGPILSLTEVAKIVSDKNDYSARAIKETNDETGMLIEAFNKMLEQIQQRESELVSSKRQLEMGVKERTADLTVTNKKLQQEIIERKRIEARQAELLDEIKNINQELDSFAYVVSHDLKAPLRGINTIAEWIATDYADKLDDNGKEQIKLLMDRVGRMRSLIDGILQYSRIGRVKEDKVQVDLNKVVKSVAEMISPPKNITITVEDRLPVIECEPTRIAQVFQNLLSNAVKYMDKPNGLVKVTCAEENGCWKFGVSDNGPGIEEKHFEKIFQLFQTLQPKEGTESTGIGLTLVKKIVEMYGGKIWVESKVGKGSTFFFTLPEQESKVTENEELEANIAG
jgi:signal transduction histidine kinase